MNVQSALELLMQERAIVVKGRTFQPTKIDKIHLLTGETEYWIHGEDHIWLSVDAELDEIRMFEDIDEEVEPSEGAVFYGSEDYEISLEGEGKVLDEDDELLDTVKFTEYESSRGAVLRLTEFEVSEDAIDVALGSTVTEEELQEV